MKLNNPIIKPLIKRKTVLIVSASSAIGLSLPPLALAVEEEIREEVVIYGAKIERSVHESIESVALISSEDIATYQLFDLEDVFNQTANAFETGNGENFGIRGVTQNSSSTGGGSGELGSLYIDGVAYTGFATRFGPKAMWDVEQVEILRGPQSTNVGRNALIGAVVVTTKNPSLEQVEGAVRIEAGNFNTQGIEAMLNLPVSDSAGFRFTAEALETDGFNENITRAEDDYDARSNRTLRAKFLLEPNDKLSVGVMAQYAKTERGQNIFLVSSINAPNEELDARTSIANLDAFENYEASSAAIDIRYDFSPNISLVSTSSYIGGDYERRDDDDEGPGGGNSFRGRIVEDENVAQELRLNIEYENLKGVAGVYYTEVDLDNDTVGLVNIAPATLGVPGSLLPFYPANIEVDVASPAEQTVVNAAFFTEWDFKLHSSWRLSAGFRYDSEEKDFISNTQNTLREGSELPDPAEAGALSEMLAPGSGAAVTAGVTQVNAGLMRFLVPTDNSKEDTRYEAFLPKLGLSYFFNPDVSLGLMAKRGYRAGGVDISLAAQRSEYEPEYLDNLELSFRSRFYDNKLTVNANAYWGDWTDQQVNNCPMGPLSCFTLNAGESEIRGLELDIRYALNSNFGLFASAGHSETEFIDFVDGDNDFSGNEFAFSPKKSYAAGMSYRANPAWSFTGSVNYQGQSWGDFENETLLNSRLLLNLNVRYQYENWLLTLYGKNVTDDLYLTSSNLGLDDQSRIVRVGPPRELGLKLQYSL